MPELGGDIVMASSQDGRCVVQFIKTPLALVLAQTSRTNWLIEFPPAHRRLYGPRFAVEALCLALPARCS